MRSVAYRWSAAVFYGRHRHGCVCTLFGSLFFTGVSSDESGHCAGRYAFGQGKLAHAFTNGDALEARANMMSAALMGAVAFQKGLGGAHALTHSVGAMYNTHHGMTCAVVLPAVLRFNRPAIESRIAAAADYLGIGGGFDGFYDICCCCDKH